MKKSSKSTIDYKRKIPSTFPIAKGIAFIVVTVVRNQNRILIDNESHPLSSGLRSRTNLRN